MEMIWFCAVITSISIKREVTDECGGGGWARLCGITIGSGVRKERKTIGYDLSSSKVESYKQFIDPTGEVSSDDLKAAEQLHVTTDPAELSQADYIVVAVPTPVDAAHQPDFRPLAGASETVGKHMKRGTTVIYESTVYPEQPRKSVFLCWRNIPA